MRAAVFCYSGQGKKTALEILYALPGDQVRLFCPERMSAPPFFPLGKPPAPFYANCFHIYDALIFVSSAGLAVREIAPNVRRKDKDPAVICVDDRKNFVIPLLSGHLGGANRISRKISGALGARCVITTATDVNGRFAVDEWADRFGFSFDLKEARRFSSEILERDLPFWTDLPVEGPLPSGLYASERGGYGLVVSARTETPFEETLFVAPRTLHLGIGCRRSVTKEMIEETVDAVFRENALNPDALFSIASIDLKRGEKGLLSYAKSRGLTPAFYTAEELNALEGSFTESAFVKETTGTGSVCERAALMEGDRLLVKKTAKNGVTCAVSESERKIRFE